MPMRHTVAPSHPASTIKCKNFVIGTSYNINDVGTIFPFMNRLG